MAREEDILVLGAGLAGLSAGAALAEERRRVTLVESGSAVGGLARTIEHDGFRFDLGGHRFLTDDARVKALVESVLGADLLTVKRRSSIFLRGRYFDYPLRPANAVLGLGFPTTLAVLADYVRQKIHPSFRPGQARSLEEWVVAEFGRKMFDLYFREYSEKVWGIGCDRISSDWVSRRIEGLSLAKAVRGALFRRSSGLRTLADSFWYPATGIGLLASRLRDRIERTVRVLTNTKICRIDHEGFEVKNVLARDEGGVLEFQPDAVISTLPLTSLVRLLNPAPPLCVRSAANALRFRDLVVCAVMLGRRQATDLTWLYFPEHGVPFGRLHEPRNWSPCMAPEGTTHLVAEYFCFAGDGTWNADDRSVSAQTIHHLARLGFIHEREVIGSCVVRVPRAYPVFDLDYRRHCDTIREYLAGFRDLRIAGRSGSFQYFNMDQAMASGIAAARKVLQRQTAEEGVKRREAEAVPA